MFIFDIILLCVIGGFGLFGWRFGLVSTIGSLAGTVLGVFLATRWYAPLAEWLMRTTGWTGNFSKVIVFILAFLIINRLIGFIFYILGKALSVVTRLPFIHTVDRLLGSVFGFFEGVIVLGIIFYFIGKFPLSPSFMNYVGQSKLAPLCGGVASILFPFVPEAVKSIKNFI
ncbi:MAG: CvpA family protein [Candidatus Magasanikbacteria bacterium]|nr:CvpA family protein [Candidatus Magasanikbacteria bacterium]